MHGADASSGSAPGAPDNPTQVLSSRVPESRVLLVAAFGAFLAFLDVTIVNVAFPSIRESFPGTSIAELSWVLNAYNIVLAAALVLCGRLADLLGRRRLYVGGIALFALASLWCAAAGSVGMLVTDREAPDDHAHNRVIGPDFQWRPSGNDVVAGQYLFTDTRTPNGFNSKRRASLIASTACLLAWYAPAPGNVSRPPMELTLTMRPHR